MTRLKQVLLPISIVFQEAANNGTPDTEAKVNAAWNTAMKAANPDAITAGTMTRAVALNFRAESDVLGPSCFGKKEDSFRANVACFNDATAARKFYTVLADELMNAQISPVLRTGAVLDNGASKLGYQV